MSITNHRHVYFEWGEEWLGWGRGEREEDREEWKKRSREGREEVIDGKGLEGREEGKEVGRGKDRRMGDRSEE